jgi:TM2 domain-containing membrane protein YozV
MYHIIGSDGRQYGPVRIEQLREWMQQGRVTLQTKVRPDAGGDWQPLAGLPEFSNFAAAPPMASGSPAVAPPSSADRASTKLAAGLCGILLGSLGIHKFILGYTGAGLIMLLVSVLTCGFAWPVIAIIGLIEGILYLTKSDEEFVRTYVDGRKEWF